jgi:hypothetical protein
VNLRSLGLDKGAETRAQQLSDLALRYAKIIEEDRPDFLVLVDTETGDCILMRLHRRPSHLQGRNKHRRADVRGSLANSASVTHG